MNKVKSAARKEAWRDPSNPFGRSRTHDDKPRDLETGLRISQSGPPRRSTEPAPTLDSDSDRQQIRSDPRDEEKDRPGHMSGGADSRAPQTSEETAVDESTSSAHVLPSSDSKTHHGGLISRFRRNKSNSENQTHTDLTTTTSNTSKKHRHKFTVRNQIRATLFNSWINVLLVAAPVGIAMGAMKMNDIAVFVINFVAIIPLAALLSYATEEIAIRVGETLGGLLNASFGNAVELIVSIIALTKDEILIVKTSLIGSILSNLLLVMGMCFFFGGLRRTEQFFNETVAQTAASILALAIAAVIIPTAFDLWVENTGADKVAAISRGTSVILLFVYGAYLFFQLKTHAELYAIESQKVAMRPRKKHLPQGHIQRGLAAAGGIGAGLGRTQAADDDRPPNDEIMNPRAYEENPQDNDDDEPQLHLFVALGLLAGSTAVVAACAEYMVGSIAGITAGGTVSTEFVGLILLPIVGNAAEHATAVTVAIKDKMDLAIGVAVGSSMQIALLVIPFTVVLGWILGKDDMNLSFDGFQVAVLFVSVLLVNYLIADGKSHWLEGIMLNCLYLIIAVTAWFYPSESALKG